MEIIYGCECTKNCMVHMDRDAAKAPVTFLVLRDDKTIKDCSRCDLTRDTRLARCYDNSTEAKPFFDYDPIGALCMLSEKYMDLPLYNPEFEYGK